MDIVKHYDFVIVEQPNEDHPYFLHDYTPSEGERFFCAKLLKKQKPKGQLFFVLKKDGTAISLKNAPFGGFWLEKKISSESFQVFVEELTLELKALGANTLTVIQPPDIYESNNPLIHYILKTQGFFMDNMLLHHFLEDRRFMKGFLHAKSSKHRKRIKKLEYEIEVGGIKNFNFLKDIKWWRSQRGHEYNVQEEKLIQQVSTYPERYFLISLVQAQNTVAHVLCVKLTPNSLYYYLPAINPTLQETYTGEALLFEVVKLGESLGVDFIDFGSSDLDGKANHNLIRFKSKNANKAFNKISWTIKL
ncbi:GNAT family N-acetyltransferase [Echinicola sp. CAU 1574]|uniref:GNAT family N-acetyltransferase n=1 Tax=Echinicola arenosa TaxID=2774144 RepID=A0ABR9AEL8_9BACT|nr:GNAT family N-acetyltransferase [Echinicola arenosa]MBD8487212.1 GNAT family N-acetyltransferase [Echinicola arenosa]